VELKMVGMEIGRSGMVRVQMVGVGLPMVTVVVELILEPLLMVLARVMAVAAEMMTLDPLLTALVRVLVVTAVQARETKLVQVLQRRVTPLMLLGLLLLQLAALLRAARLVSLLVLFQTAAVLMILQATTLIVILQAVTLLLTTQQEQMPVPHLRCQVQVQLSVMRRAQGSILTSCQEMSQGQPE